ncbi:DUF3883 domain-containing protein [Marinobacterium sedimentorum]|uniref:DUF3883 domain-containing protein n=1 Tax=Marinobacterium sedimentorum TaxID=2927804 RepID=UPI0020C667C4|nr:DUF3883 domain-containing protein [Marinobacterium sedimentorum]MCP8687157.1 DUF3883 domain-containing protein [Marinobacterium sedimentorum]
MYERIALVKTGWSDDYQGGIVVGRHSHINDYEEAGESFNFRQCKDGRYYAYIPPIGKNERSPQPREKYGWLILFVSARKGSGPLTVVGWYRNAIIHDEYIPRPEYDLEDDFPVNKDDEPFTYCISSDEAYMIPTSDRRHTITGGRIKRSPIMYLRGNGADDPWREGGAELAEAIVHEQAELLANNPPTLVFPDADVRKRIEKSAVDAVIKQLSGEYSIADRQKDNCGYDLLARHKKNGDELHIEVKGTSRDHPHFYMTRNEHRYMRHPQWRLGMVTNALEDPEVAILNAREVSRVFELEPFAWEAVAK